MMRSSTASAVQRSRSTSIGGNFTATSYTVTARLYADVAALRRRRPAGAEAARRSAPCVLFLDEVDALGHKRAQLTSSAMRTLSNQLLAELDGIDGNNDASSCWPPPTARGTSTPPCAAPAA